MTEATQELLLRGAEHRFVFRGESLEAIAQDAGADLAELRRAAAAAGWAVKRLSARVETYGDAMLALRETLASLAEAGAWDAGKRSISRRIKRTLVDLDAAGQVIARWLGFMELCASRRVLEQLGRDERARACELHLDFARQALGWKDA